MFDRIPRLSKVCFSKSHNNGNKIPFLKGAGSWTEGNAFSSVFGDGEVQSIVSGDMKCGYRMTLLSIRKYRQILQLNDKPLTRSLQIFLPKQFNLKPLGSRLY